MSHAHASYGRMPPSGGGYYGQPPPVSYVPPPYNSYPPAASLRVLSPSEVVVAKRSCCCTAKTLVKAIAIFVLILLCLGAVVLSLYLIYKPRMLMWYVNAATVRQFSVSTFAVQPPPPMGPISRNPPPNNVPPPPLPPPAPEFRGFYYINLDTDFQVRVKNPNNAPVTLLPTNITILYQGYALIATQLGAMKMDGGSSKIFPLSFLMQNVRLLSPLGPAILTASVTRIVPLQMRIDVQGESDIMGITKPVIKGSYSCSMTLDTSTYQVTQQVCQLL
eukprot:TRINITY_DN13496_c0_g1_i4.p1 TRINITY_DN13496_c0_g1~~TRINITY_DN13496_c0_g1_i4.p1  ORF type:complete len:276 (+),score=43.33 TRINITY_DN13496_c0_g1_i4:239-1066(+)